jgi:hypothetical protein
VIPVLAHMVDSNKWVELATHLINGRISQSMLPEVGIAVSGHATED